MLALDRRASIVAMVGTFGVDVALDPELLRRAKDEFASGRGYP